MSDPILVTNKQLEDLDISADAQSEPIALQVGGGYCIMSVNTGTAVGVASLQVSPDGPESLYGAGGIWFDLIGTELAVDGTGNTNVWNVDGAKYPYVRVKYVSTSDTGTMSIFVSVKNI